MRAAGPIPTQVPSGARLIAVPGAVVAFRLDQAVDVPRGDQRHGVGQAQRRCSRSRSGMIVTWPPFWIITRLTRLEPGQPVHRPAHAGVGVFGASVPAAHRGK